MMLVFANTIILKIGRQLLSPPLAALHPGLGDPHIKITTVHFHLKMQCTPFGKAALVLESWVRLEPKLLKVKIQIEYRLSFTSWHDCVMLFLLQVLSLHFYIYHTNSQHIFIKLSVGHF